jgi:hypothetical protein
MYHRSVMSQPGAVPYNIADLVCPTGRGTGGGRGAAPARGQQGRQLQLRRRGALASQEEEEEGDQDAAAGWEGYADEAEEVSEYEDDEEEMGDEEEEEEEGQGIDIGATQAPDGMAPSQYFSVLRREDEDEDLEGFVVDDEEEEGSGDGNDDWCTCCRHGGDLLCCDGCSSAYHLACLRMEQVPDGEQWLCPECTLKLMKEQRKKKGGRLAKKRALTDT